MKKLIAVFLIAILVAGCGKSSVLPLSYIPPPAITSYGDIKVSNPKNDVEAGNIPFWFKAELIAMSVLAIIACGYMCYGIVGFKRELKRFDSHAKSFDSHARSFECEFACLESQLEEKNRHAGHQTNHPGYRIGSSEN